ncbi:type VII secretion integral membrane protein EccD [Mycobacterium sp.]|uniref:type VII secretion integral membrane protein EccD n=1 Tax=Mycobacterium sp. TaxID=1785 RepID=UPI003D13C756
MRQAAGAPGDIRRLSIHAESARVDVVVSATVAVGLLIPAIVDALAGGSDVDAGRTAVRYQLSTLAGTPLPTSKTLREMKIRDGTALTLIHSSAAFVAPTSDDTAEAVSAAVAATELRWNRRAAQLVSALVASCWAGVGAVVLLRTALDGDGTHRAICVGIAATISFLSLLAAVVACRVFSTGGAGLTLGLTATGFAALAGLLAVPGGPGAPNALFAAAATATSAAIVRMIACRAILFDILTCFAATCLAAAIVGVVTAEPMSIIGAGLAAISLAMIEASPQASAMLARLTPDAPDHLNERAIRAHDWLVSFVAAFSASATLGAVGALLRYSAPSVVLAAVVGSVLMLRARTHPDIALAVPTVICGAVTLSAALVGCAARYPHHALYIAVLAATLGCLALYVGFVGVAATGSPFWRRGLELVEYLAFATVVPLTFWVGGLFGAVRSVNLT